MESNYNTRLERIFADRKRNRTVKAVLVLLCLVISMLAITLTMQTGLAATTTVTTEATLRTELTRTGTNTIIVGANITLASPIAIPSGADNTLTANGVYSITAAASGGTFTNGVIQVNSGAKLTIGTSSSETLTIDGNARSHVITVNGTGTLNMYGGKITKGKAPTNNAWGGGVLIGSSSGATNGATFNMYGGTISYCEAIGTSLYNAAGGGVCVMYKADTFNMRGGTIAFNTAISIASDGADGGGVYVGFGRANIYAGNFYNNLCNFHGGAIGTGVAGRGGRTYVYDPVIAGNQAYGGGGLFGCPAGGVRKIADKHTAIFENKSTNSGYTNAHDVAIASGTKNTYTIPTYMLDGVTTYSWTKSSGNLLGVKKYPISGITYPFSLTASESSIITIINRLKTEFPKGKVFIVNNFAGSSRAGFSEAMQGFGGGIGGNGDEVEIDGEDDGVSATINGRKTLNPTTAPTDQKFNFTITRVTTSAGTTNSTGTDAYTQTIGPLGAGDFSFTVSNLARPASGTTNYYYKIVEDTFTAGGWTRSTNVYVATVAVPSGTANPTVTIARTSGTDAEGTVLTGPCAEFINRYSTTSATINGRKTLNPTTAPTDQKFNFTITRVTTSAGTTNSTGTDAYTQTIGPLGAGDFSFTVSNLVRPASGTTNYYYKIVEDTFTAGGWTRSTNVYVATVAVPSGTAAPTVTIARTSGTDAEGTVLTGPRAEFINRYSTTSATINGRKTLNPTTAPTDQKFNFTITRVTTSAGTTNSTGTDAYTQTIGPLGAGDFSFTVSNLVRPASGTTNYYYKIVEDTFTAGGWTRSTNVYVATVAVPSDTTAPTVTCVRISGSDVEGTVLTGDRVEFINRYEAPEVVVILKALKNAAGKDMLAREFNFHLYELSQWLAKAAPGKTADNEQGGAQSEVHFAPLTFTQTGEYDYILVEESTPHEGWAMDPARYLIHILVYKDPADDNKMKAEVTWVEADEDGNARSGNWKIYEKDDPLKLWPSFRNEYGGPAFPEVGGFGLMPFLTGGIAMFGVLTALYTGYIYRRRRRWLTG